MFWPHNVKASLIGARNQTVGRVMIGAKETSIRFQIHGFILRNNTPTVNIT
jgi:hypothetical protein